MANYLLTGGAGFIGSNLAQVLVEKGDTVVIVDDLSMGNLAKDRKSTRLNSSHRH